MDLKILEHFKGHWNYSILDQMLFSATGIITTVLCARILEAEVFGIWAILILISLLQSDINRALIIQPMMRYAANITPENYYGRPLKISINLIILGSFIASFISIIVIGLSSNQLKTSINLMCLLILFFFARALLDMLRGVLQAYERGQLLLFIDAIHSLSLLAFLLFFNNHHSSANTINALFIITSLHIATSIIAVLTFYLFWKTPSKNINLASTYITSRELINTHIAFGGWLALANTIKWCGSNAILLASAYFLTTSETGLMRASISIFGPIGIAFQLADNLLFVRISALQSASKTKSADHLFAIGSISLLIITALIVYLITISHGYWLVPLFGESFSDVAQLLPWMSAAYISLSIVLMAQIKLRLHGKTKDLFRINVIIAVTTLALMPIYFSLFGVHAFAMGVVVNNTLLLLLVIWIFWRLKHASSLPHHTRL